MPERDYQLEGCIRYNDAKLYNARLMQVPADIALLEQTIKYLKELQALKQKEVKL